MTDTDQDSDFRILVNDGKFKLQDTTNGNANRLLIESSGTVDIAGNLDVGAGVDVTGNITVSGTVDGRDIASDANLLLGVTQATGVLHDSVTTDTPNAGDNSTHVATTAFVTTAVGNVTTDLVGDTSPQLGADLDVNDFNIKNGTSLIDITDGGRIEVDIAGTEILDINGNGVDVVGSVDLGGLGKISLTGSTVQPFTFKNNGRTGTYNQSVIYVHGNNNSNNLSNGIVFEVGRLTDSSSAEVGKFTIATRGGQTSALIDQNGIKFNGDTASANGLNDYEEGTFTPQILFGGNNSGQSYGAQVGRYTKIGNRVFFHLYIYFTNKGSSSGSARLHNLPYTSGASGSYAHVSFWINSSNYGNTTPTGYIPANQTYIVIERQRTDGGGVYSVDNTNFNSNTDMMISGSYIV